MNLDWCYADTQNNHNSGTKSSHTQDIAVSVGRSNYTSKKKKKKSKDKTAPAKILVSSRNFSKTYPYSLVKLVNIIF